MLFRSLDKCTPTSSPKQVRYNKFVLDLFQGAKKGVDDATRVFSVPPGNRPVFVSWVSRCHQLSGLHPYDQDILDLTIAWSQRHHADTGLIEHITIIPTYIMREVSIMYNHYSSNHVIERTMRESISPYDEHHFMEAALPVMKYLLEHPDRKSVV